MYFGVTHNSVQSLTLLVEVNRIVTAEDKSLSDIAQREQENRPPNEDRIRGIF